MPAESTIGAFVLIVATGPVTEPAYDGHVAPRLRADSSMKFIARGAAPFGVGTQRQ